MAVIKNLGVGLRKRTTPGVKNQKTKNNCSQIFCLPQIFREQIFIRNTNAIKREFPVIAAANNVIKHIKKNSNAARSLPIDNYQRRQINYGAVD